MMMPHARAAFVALLASLAFVAATVVAPRTSSAEPPAATAGAQERPLDITTPGQVFEGRTFTRQVDIRADRTTFLRCTFDVERAWLYCVRVHLRDRSDPSSSYRLTRFVDCTFRGAQGKAIVGAWLSVEGTDVHAASSVIEDCGSDGVYVDAAGYVNVSGVTFRRLGWAPGAHSDAVQVGGGSHVRIVGNRFEVPHLGEGVAVSNSCVFVEADRPVSHVTIASNWLDGGLYSLWVIRNSATGTAPPQHVTIRGNAFGRHYYGPFRVDTHTPDELRAENDMSRARMFRPSPLEAPVPDSAPAPEEPAGENPDERHGSLLEDAARRCPGSSRRGRTAPARAVA